MLDQTGRSSGLKVDVNEFQKWTFWRAKLECVIEHKLDGKLTEIKRSLE